MTVQEIQEIGFEKAVFGGYDMKSVDTFLERVAEEFASMQKENAALKAKMKVLVDKIEEYRGVEDGMRRALMSAQTIAQDTIDKAKKEAEEIVSVAKNETENKVKSTQDEIQLEEQKLEAAKKEHHRVHSARFRCLSGAGQGACRAGEGGEVSPSAAGVSRAGIGKSTAGCCGAIQCGSGSAGKG